MAPKDLKKKSKDSITTNLYPKTQQINEADKSLNRHNLLNLIQEETDHLYRPVLTRRIYNKNTYSTTISRPRLFG